MEDLKISCAKRTWYINEEIYSKGEDSAPLLRQEDSEASIKKLDQKFHFAFWATWLKKVFYYKSSSSTRRT